MQIDSLNVGTPTIYKVEVYITIESVVFKCGELHKKLRFVCKMM
ncbi:hypothetical protein LEP1GSC067_4291 [Leptospira interrogans serovar Lora str. TE 1992]|uniref:Uncharacterized protein n=1 Tax=Leptospira interrogans serovar Lora str. TE 1992 TaxID=1193028 RepID=M3EXZ9_LEPIR|nr:hypothetical protein LEP1GSC067_4291 [Leptospira interrogans serovar Lora str. TE 1992]EMN07479.1 hypothetical protein LEP1GSC053_1342 [Leptospira interrogans serovar Muenchen str. Brem 129]